MLYWTDAAISDRRSIYNYIEMDNPLAAIQLDELFQEKVLLLIEHPHMGRKGRLVNTRELVVHKHYIIVYKMVGNNIQLLRVLHTSLQWP